MSTTTSSDGSVRLTENHQAVITLDHDGLEWLCNALEKGDPKDGYTVELWKMLFALKLQMLNAGV